MRSTIRSPALLFPATLSLCDERGVTIGGRTFYPDDANAYVEFHLAHAFPVVLPFGTGIHPQVLANSYQSLENKILNLAHQMKSYDDRHPHDCQLGTVLAVEYPPTPPGGWRVGSDRATAPGIRAVAVLHKQAEYAPLILNTWARGRTPHDPQGEWSVSMENLHDVEESGFLVKAESGKQKAEMGQGTTPEDLVALGYTYVAWADAPAELRGCLNNKRDDERDGVSGTRVCRQYGGAETILLLNGLAGTLRFIGVGLCERGMEREARVARMLAADDGAKAESGKRKAEITAGVLGAFEAFLGKAVGRVGRV